jgi:glutamate dehydrogenase (NAD(P)+)
MDTYSMYQGQTVTEIVTGKPVAAGGTEGRREATGRGIAFLVQRALERLQLNPMGTTAVVQGFGNVGSVAAASLARMGVRIIGVSDHTACYIDRKGLDVAALERHAAEHGVLAGFSSELLADPAELLVQPCDIVVPAAMERAIDADTAARLQCRVLAEGANGPTTPEADRVLDARAGEIFVIPDILCNAGGVTVSYFEWVQDEQHLFWEAQDVYNRLEKVMKTSFKDVLKIHLDRVVPMRIAANMLGIGRVAEAVHIRGIYP